jgi:hypothetical protein
MIAKNSRYCRIVLPKYVSVSIEAVDISPQNVSILHNSDAWIAARSAGSLVDTAENPPAVLFVQTTVHTIYIQ